MTKKETRRGTFGTGQGYATDLEPVLAARYHNHSGERARDRLRAKLHPPPPMERQTTEEFYKEKVEGSYDRLTPEQQAEVKQRLVTAFSGPKADALNNMANKIRNNPGIDEYNRAALMAQLIYWASCADQS